MNGFANTDTMFAANAIFSSESLLISAKRLTNIFALRNLILDAMEQGMIHGLDVENIEFEEILDRLED